mmetsp:Transcript_35826/g.89388  ORF Transcript_35826/g.89388 Transcript_35826/m.89388 type:complete len:249 (-) Transcript_35826:79-825(-)
MPSPTVGTARSPAYVLSASSAAGSSAAVRSESVLPVSTVSAARGCAERAFACAFEHCNQWAAADAAAAAALRRVPATVASCSALVLIASELTPVDPWALAQMVSWAFMEGRSDAEAKKAVHVLLPSVANRFSAGSQLPASGELNRPGNPTARGQSAQTARTLYAFSRLGSIALPLGASSPQALLGATTGLGASRQDAFRAVARLAVRARLAHVADLAGQRAFMRSLRHAFGRRVASSVPRRVLSTELA